MLIAGAGAIWAINHPVHVSLPSFGSTASSGYRSTPTKNYGSPVNEVNRLRIRSGKAAASSYSAPKGHTGTKHGSKGAAEKAAKREAARAGGRARYRGPCKAGNHVRCDYYNDVNKARRGRSRDVIVTSHHYW